MKKLLQILLLTASLITAILSSCSKTDVTIDGERCIINFVPSIYGDSKGTMIMSDSYDYVELGPFWVTVWDKGASEPQFGYTPVKPFTLTPGGLTYWSTFDEPSGHLIEYFWKQNGNRPVTKYFYAYTNLPGTGATVENDNPEYQILSYKVPQKAKNQKDILLGASNGTGNKKEGLNSRFEQIFFFHCLSAVRFSTDYYLQWDEERGDKITKISIAGVYSQGLYYCYPEDGEWESISYSDKITVSSDGINEDETFFLIPQELYTNPVTITMSLTYNGVEYDDISCTVNNGSWEQGRSCTYYIRTLPSGTKSSFDDGGALKLELVSDTASEIDN